MDSIVKAFESTKALHNRAKVVGVGGEIDSTTFELIKAFKRDIKNLPSDFTDRWLKSFYIGRNEVYYGYIATNKLSDEVCQVILQRGVFDIGVRLEYFTNRLFHLANMLDAFEDRAIDPHDRDIRKEVIQTLKDGRMLPMVLKNKAIGVDWSSWIQLSVDVENDMVLSNSEASIKAINLIRSSRLAIQQVAKEFLNKVQ